MNLFRLSLIGSVFALAACGSNSSSGGGGTLTKVVISAADAQGIWLQKKDADELRDTGKLESRCEEIRKEPKRLIVNSKLVKNNGDIFMYVPKWGEQPTMRIGRMNFDGTVTISNEWKKAYEDAKLTVSLAGDILTFVYEFKGGWKSPMDYVRSDVNELNAYFAAQEACKKK